jgi:hypothetical protein
LRSYLYGSSTNSSIVYRRHVPKQSHLAAAATQYDHK